MSLMRTRMFIIAYIFSITVFGQDSAHFTITLKGWHNKARPLPTRFDTMYLDKKLNKPIGTFTDISSFDSTFKLSNIPIGKYWLRFSSKQYCVTPLSIVVCSKCNNNFTFFSYPKKPGDNCNDFLMVEIEPGYEGGSKVLSRDFQRNLNK